VNVLRHTDTDGIRKAKIANKNITELCNYMEQSSSQEEEEEEEEEPVHSFLSSRTDGQPTSVVNLAFTS